MEMRRVGALVLIALVLPGGCAGKRHAGATRAPAPRAAAPEPDPLAAIPNPRTPAEKIVNGAREEARRGVRYDAGYVRIPYPDGDVPRDRGACTDVVIRALRAAGHDIQRLIHEDRRRHPGRYGGGRGDRNIDHRRIPNQMTFLRHHGRSLPTATAGPAAATWQHGDLVYWRLTNGPLHCGVLSDVRGAGGLPLVIHNLGMAAQEDCLTDWEILGHFRYPARR